jgi:hypothetical protein
VVRDLALGAEVRWVGGEESAKMGFKICWLMRRGWRAVGERERERDRRE